MSASFNRRTFRERLRAQDPDAETSAEVLTDLLAACGEIARELMLPLPDFVQAALESHAAAHEKEVKYFEFVGGDEEPEAPGGDIEAVFAVKARWVRN